MTGQLRSTLQTHADDLDTWDVDLDSIVRAGDRRVRRRRATVAGGLACGLFVAGGIAAFAGHAHRTSPPPADQDAKPLAYAVGSIIHTGDGTIDGTGDGTIDVGEKVVSFVPTHWGFVFSTPDHRLHQVRNGEVEPVTTFDGHPSRLAGSTPLVTGDDGLVTAWWDGKRIQSWPGYRDGDGMVDAFDKTNSFNAAKSWPSDDPPGIQAVSDGHLWFWDGQDPWIAEVRPMTTTAGWQDTNPPGSGTVVDAAGDQVLVHTGDGMAVTKANLLPPIGQQGSWKPGGDLAGLGTQVAGVTSGDLAPDGKHWFSKDPDQFTVYDSETGVAHTFTHPGGYPSATPYEWLGDDTIAAVALYPPVDGNLLQPVNLLVCHVSTGTCVVAAKEIGTVGDVVLADGGQSIP